MHLLVEPNKASVRLTLGSFSNFIKEKFMRKLLFLTAAVCLLAVAAFAQDKKADYSGTWSLDVSKSKLDERARSIESMTMTVAQTETEISVTTETKRAAPPADAPQGGRPGGGMGRGGFGCGDGKTVYRLDGKETRAEIDGPNGKMPLALKANSDEGKLHLSRTSSFNGPMGEISITTKEPWELSAEGKTLTVNREQTTPRGTNSSTMVFAKK